MFLKFALFLQIIVTILMGVIVLIAWIIGEAFILKYALEVYLQTSVVCCGCLLISIPIKKIEEKIFDI